MEMPVLVSIIVMLFAALLMMIYALLLTILVRLDRLNRRLDDIVRDMAGEEDDPDPGDAANDNYVPSFVSFGVRESSSRY